MADKSPKKGSTSKSFIKGVGGKETKVETRTQESSEMSTEETEKALGIVRGICSRGKRGVMFLITEDQLMDEKGDIGSSTGVMLYSNGMKPSAIRKVFHEAMEGIGAPTSIEEDFNSLESIRELIKSLKRQL